MSAGASLSAKGFDRVLSGSGEPAHVLFSKSGSSKRFGSTGRRRRLDGTGASPSASAKCNARRHPR